MRSAPTDGSYLAKVGNAGLPVLPGFVVTTHLAAKIIERGGVSGLSEDPQVLLAQEDSHPRSKAALALYRKECVSSRIFNHTLHGRNSRCFCWCNFPYLIKILKR